VTAYEVKQLMAEATEMATRKIILSLGGGYTNDFSVWTIVAVGARFLDEKGNEFVPVGDCFCKIAKIDKHSIMKGLKKRKPSRCTTLAISYSSKGTVHIFG
jgi:glycerate kinase